jgi:ferredoxin-nitrate reductase
MTEDRITNPWGDAAPFGPADPWPERVDQYLRPGVEEADVERWVHSTCILCSNGCGMDIAVKDGEMVGVRGQGYDRVNHGRLGPKGLFGWQANNAADRLTRPLIRRDGRLVETDWDSAMNAVVRRSRELLDESGAGAIGFYNSGQLFLEEYYTLSLVTKAGIGTPHVDGNTRLCTATADEALKETFGSDGDPASYRDVDLCDTLFLVGHNVAETQTVLWARMRDRLLGPERPRLVVVDPRATVPAQEADVHLAPRPGTNVALLNAILHELIVNDWVDHDWVGEHTIGYERLATTVREYTPERVAEISQVPAGQIRQAARIVGTGSRLLSTCLQGVYQSNQATAAACQINNINLLRGMIGRPGCGVMQMNGQPTAQNTRECGADGDMPGMRNWQNDQHMEELARLWNVDVATIPHWSPPTHVMQMLRYAELGSLQMLWVIGTNPAVSLPELSRVRALFEQQSLFLVVSDAYLNETGVLADVVLPAALWGEKTGTFTNADRTVHLSDRAVAPPGEARSDFDMLVDYAQRMGFEDRDGQPLVRWRDPEEAFEAWKECSRGRPCDYTGITYERLRGGGIQWPCTEAYPGGIERLYADGVFNTDPDYCEEYGRDLVTGAQNDEAAFRAMNPAGRAVLKSAAYIPAPEGPDGDYPYTLNTGRTVYHWHTRTKTGRVAQLDDAAPDVWVELAVADAKDLGVEEDAVVRVQSRRGSVEGPVRIVDRPSGAVFVPFHYGSPTGKASRAANELTKTSWDPVSKQPLLKSGAVRVIPLEALGDHDEEA